MKRCPKCRQVETDDTLAFCRADGTPLVRESGEVNEAAGTLKFSSQPATGETPTRIVPTGESAGRPTATTTVLNPQRATGWTQGLSKPKSHRSIIIGAAVLTAFVLAVSAYLYFSSGKNSVAKNSIAVLPFENATNDPDMEYLSDAFRRALLTVCRSCPTYASSPAARCSLSKARD